MVERLTFPQTTEIEQLSGQKLICMQNGALNHHILAVRISLNNGFPNGWMSRDLKKESLLPSLREVLTLPLDFFSGASQKTLSMLTKFKSPCICSSKILTTIITVPVDRCYKTRSSSSVILLFAEQKMEPTLKSVEI